MNHLHFCALINSYVWFPSIGCLDPENFKQFKLMKKTKLTHNVAKFKFELPTPSSVLGLPIRQHISGRYSVYWLNVNKLYLSILWTLWTLWLYFCQGFQYGTHITFFDFISHISILTSIIRYINKFKYEKMNHTWYKMPNLMRILY